MSKLLSLMIEKEGLELPPANKDTSSQELVATVIQNIMFNFSKNGIRRDERKQYYRIVEALDKAVKEKKETVELDDDLAGFLRKCQRDASLTPNRLLQRVEDLIEDIRDI